MRIYVLIIKLYIDFSFFFFFFRFHMRGFFHRKKQSIFTLLPRSRICSRLRTLFSLATKSIVTIQGRKTSFVYFDLERISGNSTYSIEVLNCLNCLSPEISSSSLMTCFRKKENLKHILLATFYSATK